LEVFPFFPKAYIKQIRPIYAKEIHGFFESARLGVTRGVVSMPEKRAGKRIF
jgi:hypothetical protein